MVVVVEEKDEKRPMVRKIKKKQANGDFQREMQQ